MKTKPYLFLLFLILTVFSCSNRDAAKMLNDIESYMQERPDSALAEIRSIDTTCLNTRELRAKYSLLHAMALDKNYINTTDIRIIEPALSFYTHHGRRRMLTHFYAGRIHENEQDYADALIFYNDALENASEQDYLYRGLINSYIANVYHHAYSFSEELHYKEIALGYFEKLGERHYIDFGIFGLANAWHNNRDFNKADSLYREISAQGDSLRPLAVAAASARHRVQRYQESENLLNQLAAYPATYTSTWWRYKTEKDKGNYEEAESLLEESIQMQNLIVREKIAQSIFKSQSEFFKHAAHSAQQKKTIQRQRYLVTILFLLLVLSLITFLYLRKKSSMSRENARLLLAMDESEKMLDIMKTDFEKKYADIEEEKAAQKKKMLELQKMYAGLYQKQF